MHILLFFPGSFQGAVPIGMQHYPGSKAVSSPSDSIADIETVLQYIRVKSKNSTVDVIEHKPPPASLQVITDVLVLVSDGTLSGLFICVRFFFVCFPHTYVRMSASVCCRTIVLVTASVCYSMKASVCYSPCDRGVEEGQGRRGRKRSVLSPWVPSVSYFLSLAYTYIRIERARYTCYPIESLRKGSFM